MEKAMDFDKIDYVDELHQYSYKGVPLWSVTQAISSVKKPFDTEKMAKIVADRDGTSVEIVKQMWKEKSDLGKFKGSEVHNYIERFVEDKPVLLAGLNEVLPEQYAFQKFWKRFVAEHEPVVHKIEWKVGDVSLGVAGRIDAIFEVTFKGQRRYMILDWKTGRFETRTFNDFMLSPFGHLASNDFNPYSLQISLYRLILERNTDLDVVGGSLIHLKDTGEYNVYDAKDLRKEAEEWLSKKVPVAMYKSK